MTSERLRVTEDGPPFAEYVAAWEAGTSLTFSSLLIDQEWLDALFEATSQPEHEVAQEYYFSSCVFVGPIDFKTRTFTTQLKFEFCEFDAVNMAGCSVHYVRFESGTISGDADFSDVHTREGGTFFFGAKCGGTTRFDRFRSGAFFKVRGTFSGPVSLRDVTLASSSSGFGRTFLGPVDMTGMRSLPGSKLHISGVRNTSGAHTSEQPAFQGPIIADGVVHHADLVKIRTPEPAEIMAWATEPPAIRVGERMSLTSRMDMSIDSGPLAGISYRVDPSTVAALLSEYLGDVVCEVARTDYDFTVHIEAEGPLLTLRSGDTTRTLQRTESGVITEIFFRRTLEATQ